MLNMFLVLWISFSTTKYDAGRFKLYQQENEKFCGFHCVFIKNISELLVPYFGPSSGKYKISLLGRRPELQTESLEIFVINSWSKLYTLHKFNSIFKQKQQCFIILQHLYIRYDKTLSTTTVFKPNKKCSNSCF